jgi:hypothetical protein
MRKSRQPRGGCGERMQDSPRFPFPRLSFCEDRKTSLANAEALLRKSTGEEAAASRSPLGEDQGHQGRER